MEAQRSRREERIEETRHELLAAAMRVFAERGFHDASMQEIAEAARYTTGAIYWHFKSKDELFLAAFDEFAIMRVGEFEAATDTGGDLPRRARNPADQWMARQAADPTFLAVAIEYLAYAWRDPERRKPVATRAAAVRLAVGRFLEHEIAAADLDLPIQTQDLATILRELGVGLSLAKLADPDAFPDRLYGDFVELFFELALSDSARNTRAASKTSKSLKSK